MDEIYDALDMEFKRYLQILRPYLGQLLDEEMIEICNAWIQRLSDCQENERPLRNKYVFTLCYQLAKGMLNEPFLKNPPDDELSPLPEGYGSEVSSTEIEYLVINAEEHNTKLLFDNKKPLPSDTEHISREQDDIKELCKESCSDMTSCHDENNKAKRQTVLCYNCPKILSNYNYETRDELYEHRATNLIRKLKEIKTDNVLLHKELSALKEESRIKSHCNYPENYIFALDNATSAFILNNDSNSTLKSLKLKFQEVQESRNALIENIANLQNQLENFNDMKYHEIDDIKAKHKLELIKIKSEIREDNKNAYEMKINELKQNYEAKIYEIQSTGAKEKQDLLITKDEAIGEKNKLINSKDIEISRLQNQIEGLKKNLRAGLDSSTDKTTDDLNGSMRKKAEQLEMRLGKMEKNKNKCARLYEAKLAHVQRQKHLAECSLQLQMVRQRAQVVSEVTDDSQAELTTALDKLETKYKEILANVQTTAIQRRMQDKMALETILQAACGIPSDNPYAPGPNDQFSAKAMRNQNRSYDSEISSLMRGNKVGNVIVGNKSGGEESLVTGYCLNGERMGKLFERVYIPQRDNVESMK